MRKVELGQNSNTFVYSFGVHGYQFVCLNDKQNFGNGKLISFMHKKLRTTRDS